MRLFLGTTVLAAVVLSGCASTPKPPANAAVAGKLALDSSTGLPSLTSAQLTCVTGVLVTYVKPSDLSNYVAGRLPFAQLTTSNEAKTQAGVDACLGH